MLLKVQLVFQLIYSVNGNALDKDHRGKKKEIGDEFRKQVK